MIEPQWLTYREAAERLGITADAVVRRAGRHKWPKLLPNRPGNPIRIQVPGDQFHRPPPAALPPPSDRSPPVDTDLTAALAQRHAAARGRPRPLCRRRVGPRPGRCRPADRRPRAPGRGGARRPEEARAPLVEAPLLIRRGPARGRP